MVLIAMLCVAGGAWADELTVYEDAADGSSYVPFYGMYADVQGVASECVIPSDELTAMAGGTITAMKFYIKQSADEAWTGTHQVYIGEVAETTLTGITGPTAFTVVKEASFDATGTELTVTFDTPYTYGGGNLLIGTYVSVAGSNYKSAYFYGVNQEANTARYRSSGSGAGSAVKFIPKTTFTYTGGSGVVVEKPQTFEASSITSSGAVLTWTGGTGTYNLEYKKAADEEWTVVLSNTTATTYTFTGLESNTKYQARVQSVSGSDVSGWKSLSFTTAVGFPYSEDFTAGLPATWTRYNGLLENILNNSTSLASATSGWSVGTGNGVLDGNHAYANIYGNYQRWLVTPAILLPANAKITFDVAYTAYNSAADPAQDGDDDKFVVLISTDDMATWTILRQWDNAGSTFVLNKLTPAGENVSIALGDYAGQSVNVAFYVESTVNNADNNLHIDNVAFLEKDPFEKPTGLSVNYTGDQTATVTWTDAEGAISYDIDVNGTVTEGVRSPYELAGLLLSGTYEVKVRANYGEGNYSEWTDAVTFKTDDCMNADKCYITYELSANAYNGSYNYGWYYSGIDVYNADTNELIDFWTVDASKATATGALAVCPGTNLSFQWYCSYSPDNDNILVGNIVVKDANGEAIINQTGVLTAAVNYTVDCTISEFKKPTDFVATWVGATSADLSWTENGTATEWVIEITDNDEEETWEVTATENPYKITNLTPDTEYYVRVRPAGENDKWSEGIFFNTSFTAPADLAADDITINSASISWKGDADKYNLRYASFTPGEVLFSYDFENGLAAQGWTVLRNGEGTDVTDWRQFTPSSFGEASITAHSGAYVAMSRSYNNNTGYNVDNWMITPAIELDGTLKYWVRDDGLWHEHYDIYVCTTSFDADAFDESAFTKIYEPGDASGEWTEHTVDLSAYAGQTGYIAFRNTDNNQDFLFIDDVVISMPDIKGEYTDVADVTSPYALEDLADNTSYIVEVQGVYGSTPTEWASVEFTTIAGDAAPTNLEIADVTATNATLSWNGVQDSYNVKLTKLPVFDVDKFTQVDEDKTATGELTEYSFDLSSYSGTGAIAIRHYNVTDMFRLNVDDIVVRNAASEVVLSEDFESGLFPSGWVNYDADGDGNVWGMWQITSQDSQGNDVGNGSYCITSASYNGGALTPDNWLIIPNVELGGTLTFVARGQDPSWAAEVFGVFVGVGAEAFTPATETTFENVTSPYALENLLPGTEYTVQVQGIYKGEPTEWSEVASFTTEDRLDLANDATDNSDRIEAYYGKDIDVKLTGRTLFKDGNWNTICLPFDVTIADSPLAGATAKTLTDATVTGEHVTLNFGEAVDELEAGKPYIIKWDGDGTNNIVEPVFTGVTIKETDENDNTISLAESQVQFIGYFDALEITAENDDDIYYMTAENTLKHTGKDRTLKACRAYFKFSIAEGARSFTLNFGDGESTAINETIADTTSDDSWYGVDGVKIYKQPARKGLYIQNGKKVVIK